MPARFPSLLLALLLLAGGAAAAPRVVVSMQPVHGLIAGVMAGIGQPHLLLAARADPHGHALRPSQARALARADAVFWIGPVLEGYLRKALASLATGARVVALSDSPGVYRLPARKGGIWEEHDDENHAGDADGGDGARQDPHTWLDPRNAQAMVRQAVAVLAQIDPANGNRYRRNGAGVIADLIALEAEMVRQLAPVRHRPYIVLHDAFQYFEARFETNAQGAIAIDPDRQPGARRIATIRQRLRQGKLRCLFREAGPPAKIVDTLTRGLGIRVATLDPIGREIPPGPKAYGRLLRQLANSLKGCL